ncbi:MAG: PHP-associated domain-containing protein, partial [Promethearchaeota archaeon]
KIKEESKKEIFKFVDGIEILNGRVSKKANKFARKVNSLLNLKGIGGSDAHELYEVGKVVTEFRYSEILNEKEQKIISIHPDTTIQEAVNLMVENNIGAILTKENDIITGIFTER